MDAYPVALADLLKGALSAGEGLICNNVLHNRSQFEENPEAPRLLYRLRYYNRIATDILMS